MSPTGICLRLEETRIDLGSDCVVFSDLDGNSVPIFVANHQEARRSAEALKFAAHHLLSKFPEE